MFEQARGIARHVRRNTCCRHNPNPPLKARQYKVQVCQQKTRIFQNSSSPFGHRMCQGSWCWDEVIGGMVCPMPFRTALRMRWDLTREGAALQTLRSLKSVWFPLTFCAVKPPRVLKDDCCPALCCARHPSSAVRHTWLQTVRHTWTMQTAALNGAGACHPPYPRALGTGLAMVHLPDRSRTPQQRTQHNKTAVAGPGSGPLPFAQSIAAAQGLTGTTLDPRGKASMVLCAEMIFADVTLWL